MALRSDALAVEKDLPLEALRGLAAITVLLWHCLLAFFPQWSGDGDWPPLPDVYGQPWFALINGRAAVTLFFVLSGYVLTRRYFLTGDRNAIVRGALKRWPRLAGPVLVAVIMSWLLFVSGGYRFEQAGVATGSKWLATFAYGFSMPYAQPFEPRFSDALAQGAFLTFFRGDAYYDSVLWTMRYELAGSFVAFGVALILGQIAPERRDLRLVIAAMVALQCHFLEASLAAFPVGVAIAAVAPARRVAMPAWFFAASVGLSIFLLGYSGARLGAYAFPARILGVLAPANTHIVSSAILIVSLECAPARVRRMLSGRAASALGTISFPLYLVHTLAICSVGSAAYLAAMSTMTSAAASIAAAAASIVCSFIAAAPLALFNRIWVRAVDVMARRCLTQEPSIT